MQGLHTPPVGPSGQASGTIVPRGTPRVGTLPDRTPVAVRGALPQDFPLPRRWEVAWNSGVRTRGPAIDDDSRVNDSPGVVHRCSRQEGPVLSTRIPRSSTTTSADRNRSAFFPAGSRGVGPGIGSARTHSTVGPRRQERRPAPACPAAGRGGRLLGTLRLMDPAPPTSTRRTFPTMHRPTNARALPVGRGALPHPVAGRRPPGAGRYPSPSCAAPFSRPSPCGHAIRSAWSPLPSGSTAGVRTDATVAVPVGRPATLRVWCFTWNICEQPTRTPGLRPGPPPAQNTGRFAGIPTLRGYRSPMATTFRKT